MFVDGIKTEGNPLVIDNTGGLNPSGMIYCNEDSDREMQTLILVAKIHPKRLIVWMLTDISYRKLY